MDEIVFQKMASNMTHPTYSSSTDDTHFVETILGGSIAEDASSCDDICSWKGGLYEDTVPNLQSEEWVLFGSDTFRNEDNLDNKAGSIDFNLLPPQILAAGSQVFPEGEDAPPCIEDSVVTQDSKKSRSRKRHYDHMNYEKVEKNAFVGPDSVQMKAIKRILCYLQEAVDEDPGLFSKVTAIVEECKMRHLRGENKYKHLPGAIFEKIVHDIDGSTFRRLYTKSKKFQDKRGYTKEEDEESGSMTIQVAPTSHSIGVQTSPTPSTVSTAIAYGIHMARTSMVEDEKSVENAIQEGERVVVQMDEQRRNEFWEHFLQSDCLADKNDSCRI